MHGLGQLDEWISLRIGFSILIAAALVFAGPRAFADEPPPSIVFIVLDDLGYGDLGAYGGEAIETPRLDAFAAEGMRFTRYYSAAASCTASRAGLLTGQVPAAFGIRKAFRSNSPRGLAAGPATLASVLADAGYTTGQVGKWHLGRDRPEFQPPAHGFEHAAIVPGGGPGTYRDRAFRIDGGGPVATEGHLTDVTTDFAIAFIEEHAAEPFFLNVWYHAPHRPYAPPEEFAARYPDDSDGQYAAMVSHADAEIGRLLDALAAAGLDESTLVIVTSDNGAWESGIDSNGGLRGEKGGLFEAGIRVPMMVRLPGRVATGVNDSFFSGLDWLPTLARLAGARAPHDLPGRDRQALLRGESRSDERMWFWETKPRNAFFEPESGELYDVAVQRGDWKLVDTDEAEAPLLFDVVADPGETRDLARDRPDVAEALSLAARQWRQQVGRIEPMPDVVEGDVSLGRDLWSFNGGRVVLQEDPRFDFVEADFSLRTGVVLDQLGEEQVLLERPGDWTLAVDASGRVQLTVVGEDESTTARLQSEVQLEPGRAYQLGFTVYGWIQSPNTVRLTVDGALEQESNVLVRSALVDGPITVGSTFAGERPLRGDLRGLAFWRAALNEHEVRDADFDGISNHVDNCIDTANPDQIDADADGAGNVCDADFDQDGLVEQSDGRALTACLGRRVGADGGPDADPRCSESDLNTDGRVDVGDLSAFLSLRAQARGSLCGIGGEAVLACLAWLLARQGRRDGWLSRRPPRSDSDTAPPT